MWPERRIKPGLDGGFRDASWTAPAPSEKRRNFAQTMGFISFFRRAEQRLSARTLLDIEDSQTRWSLRASNHLWQRCAITPSRMAWEFAFEEGGLPSDPAAEGCLERD